MSSPTVENSTNGANAVEAGNAGEAGFTSVDVRFPCPKRTGGLGEREQKADPLSFSRSIPLYPLFLPCLSIKVASGVTDKKTDAEITASATNGLEAGETSKPPTRIDRFNATVANSWFGRYFKLNERKTTFFTG